MSFGCSLMKYMICCFLLKPYFLRVCCVKKQDTTKKQTNKETNSSPSNEKRVNRLFKAFFTALIKVFTNCLHVQKSCGFLRILTLLFKLSNM